MIGSPSDVVDDVDEVRRSIIEWNFFHGDQYRVYFQPVNWTWHGASEVEQGQRPQSLITRQIVNDSDCLIALFWTRLGTPSGGFASGTVEEIMEFLQHYKPVAIFVRTERPGNSKHFNAEEFARLQGHLKEIKKFSVALEYENSADLTDLISKQLTFLASKLSPRLIPVEKGVPEASAYEVEQDFDRLHVQVDRMLATEQKALDRVTHFLAQAGVERPFRVLDLGCADGYGTARRFADATRYNVVALDKNRMAVERASRANAASPHLQFVNTTFPDVKIAQPASFDIVFGSEFFHHLLSPVEGLELAWEIVKPGGFLVVRCSDDGMKINFPPSNELDFLLESTNRVRGSSDRHFGRKIYTFLRSLNPASEQLEVFFDVDSTVGLGPQERVQFFDDNYAFRELYARILLESGGVRADDARRFHRWTRKIIGEQRDLFARDDTLFSMNVQNVLIARRPVEKN
jgi:SAM-dependent methyltransferase